jgi:hypothetical protein
LEQSLYPSGLQVREEDLDNTEATKIAAILARFNDCFTPGVLSGWGITVNSGNSNLIDIGNSVATPINVAYDELGERIVAAAPAVVGAVLVDNSGGPNYVFLSYNPVEGSPRAHFVTGVDLDTRLTDGFLIEIKTSISVVNLDVNGRPQILLGQVLNNYGTLVLIPPSGAVQLRQQLLVLVGTVAWKDNPLLRVTPPGTTITSKSLKWVAGSKIIVDQVEYDLSSPGVAGPFSLGTALFVVAVLDTTVTPATATIVLSPTSLNLSQLSLNSQALIGFISTDGSLSLVDGMLPAHIQSDTSAVPGSGDTTILTRLNQILSRIKDIFGTGSWLSAVSSISGIIKGAANLSNLTITGLGNLANLLGKFKGSSPLSNDFASYAGSQTGHAHTGSDGDGPRLTLDGLEVGVQRVLKLPTPTNIAFNVETAFTLDDKDYRQMFVQGVIVRIEVVVHLTGGSSITAVVTTPSSLVVSIKTGNGAALQVQESQSFASQSLNIIGGPCNGSHFSNAVVGFQAYVDGADVGKLKVKIKPKQTNPTFDGCGVAANQIVSVDVSKITVMMVPAFSIASPGVSPGVLITQTGGGNQQGVPIGGIPVPGPGAGAGPGGTTNDSLLTQLNDLNTTLSGLD